MTQPAGGANRRRADNAGDERRAALLAAANSLGVYEERQRRVVYAECYSTLSASIGCTRNARRVGTTQASMHTPSMRIA
jgi:hypothetical protein